MDRCHSFTTLAATVLLVTCSCDRGPAPLAHAVAYEDVTREAGIDFEHYNGARGEYYYVETFGAGAAFFDYDDDGWLDIYLVNGAHLSGLAPEPVPVNRLLRSEQGVRFDDVTGQSGTGDSGYGMGCAVADYDNDGDQDLVVTNFGANVLLRNDEGDHFSDVTEEPASGMSAGAAAPLFSITISTAMWTCLSPTTWISDSKRTRSASAGRSVRIANRRTTNRLPTFSIATRVAGITSST